MELKDLRRGLWLAKIMNTHDITEMELEIEGLTCEASQGGKLFSADGRGRS